ncbi:MAG: VCBS repeat-containing protein, partial [Planctomycetota bacterium]
MLVGFFVPAHVKVGSDFEISVLADLQLDSQGEGTSAGCVLQIPAGFTFVGYRFEGHGTPYYDNNLSVNVPSLLAFYTAEPGHSLLSFHATHPFVSDLQALVPGRSRLRVFLRAGAVAPGQYTCKMALAGGVVGAWTADEPAGVRQFAAITAGPFVRTFQLGGVATVDFHSDMSTRQLGVPNGRSFLMDVVDLDGDGHQDLFGAIPGTSSAYAYQGFRRLGGSSWTPYRSALPFVAGGYHPFVSGDFDGDGWIDLVFQNGQTYFGSPLWPWLAGPLLPGGINCSPSVGDVDLDGCDDILLVGPNQDLHLYRGSPTRIFTDRRNGLPSTQAEWGSPLLADLNGDGHLDVFLPRLSSDNLWIANGLGGFRSGSGVLGVGPRNAIDADLDGDGVSELVLFSNNQYNVQTVGIRVYRATSATQWVEMTATGLPTQILVESCVALDVDGDGDTDLVTGTSFLYPDGLTVFANRGDGTFTPRTNTGLSPFGGVNRLSTGDFTGDGADDLIVQGRDNLLTYYASTRGLASYRPFGAGCAGSAGIATNRCSGLPRIGQTSVVTIAPVPTAGL